MKLEIKEPCHESWDNMKIGLISRHCEVCDKGVMDFTKMNRGEIITYMLSNPSDSVCGRLKKDQFDFHHDDIPILIEALRKQRPSNSFLILALVCLSLASCSDELKGNIDTPRVVIDKNAVIDSPSHEVLEMGELVTPLEIPEPVSKPIEPEYIQYTKGDVAVAGGICVVDPLDCGPPPPEDPPESNEVADKIHQFADEMPEFKGGMDELYKFIQKNLQYPDYEKDNDIQGNVYARFVVEKDGSITNIEILKTVTDSQYFDKEVKRVISIMPKWNPAVHRTREVRAYMTLPFRFVLKD